MSAPTAGWENFFVAEVGAAAALSPFIVAGVLLVRGCDHGLLWIAPGTIASFASGALNAWVLLVEIQR
jgi:hypothetical protein